MLPFRDYTYLGATQSVCPQCLTLAPAKIIERGGRVYFRKRCPTHGVREDFVCSDARWFDRPGYTTPARQPHVMATLPDRGCPFDCGLCTEHEQHTCVALLEITSSCNLECPMCFASSAPGGKHLTLAECRSAIDSLVEAEGQPEVLQLSGGEPTIHPRFFEIVDYACGQPIDYVMINTNGVRLARDPEFVERLARYKHKLEVYLQFDSTEEPAYLKLRGEPLLEVKQRAVENCAAAGLRLTLVATLQAGVNLDQVGPIVRYAAAEPMVSGVSFQPASFVGRHFLPEELEERVTFPDVLQELARQWPDVWREADFTPLPCAHPNAHTIAYAYRTRGAITPLARFIDIDANLGLLAGGITFTRPRARALIEQVISNSCCGPGGCGPTDKPPAPTSGLLTILKEPPKPTTTDAIAAEFFAKAMAEDLSPSDTFRVTITSFMDAYNFDVRQVMKSCVHFVLPSGHIVPFSAYNLFYRDGHVPLPPLTKGLPRSHGEHRGRTETELGAADRRG